MDILKINELPADLIHPNSVDDKFGGSKIVVIGKPGSGKSTLIKSIMYQKKHLIPVCTVFSGTEDTNGFYSKFVPPTFIFNEYDEKQVDQFITRQKKAIRKSKEDGSKLNPWSILLIDDCTDDTKVFTNPLQVGLYKRGRHWKMLYILSLQYSLDIKPNIRTNIDGTFLLRETGMKQRKQLWENYASIIPKFEDFCTIMDQLTGDYTALYIDNTNYSGTNDWKKSLYWYKAKIPPKDFKFGCDEIWHWHFSKFDPKADAMLTTMA